MLVRSTTLAEPLLRPLHEEMIRAGATVEFQLDFNGQTHGFYRYASDNQLDKISPFYHYAVEHFDAMLNIRAPFNVRELTNIDSAKKTRHQNAAREVRKRFMERSGAGQLRWCLCVFPTDAAAQDCGMSLAEYEEFVLKACFLDRDDPTGAWKELSAAQEKIVNVLNKAERFRYVGHKTDVHFSTTGRRWLNSDGKRNMPSGEVFTSPVEDSVNGTVYFDYPTLYQGADVEGVTLHVKDGYIEFWEAEKGQEALNDAFSIPGSRYFGEAAIGLNQNIQKATRNILFDEKIGGSIHMAVGASYPEAGGKNESALHWDMIKDMKNGGQIYADNRLIYENGAFLI